MSGFLKNSLPALTTPAVLSLSGNNGGFSQILKLYYCIYKPASNNSPVRSLALMITVCEIYPSHSHSRYSRVQTKRKGEKKKSQQKGTKADTCHVREGAFPYRVQHICRHSFHIKEESVTSLVKALVSPEGWNGLSKLTGSKCRQGEAVLCGAYSGTPGPLCGLGPAAVHQTSCLLAGDDAFC